MKLVCQIHSTPTQTKTIKNPIAFKTMDITSYRPGGSVRRFEDEKKVFEAREGYAALMYDCRDTSS